MTALAEITPRREGTVVPVNGNCEEAEVPRVVCLQYLKTQADAKVPAAPFAVFSQPRSPELPML